MPLKILGNGLWKDEPALRVRLATWDGERYAHQDVAVPVDQVGKHAGHRNCIGYYTDDGQRGDIADSFGGFSTLAARVRR